MYRAILVNVILYSILLMSCANYFDDDVRQDPKLTRQFRMRCTRRYSPGVCAGHVSPVWTYVFHEQNCTERIGCANYFRANRFKNYAICMKQCQGLGDVYLKMLEVEDDNKENYSVQLRKGETEPSLLNVEKEKQKQNTLSEEEQEDLSFYNYEQGDNETHSIVYNDYLKREDIFPPDVDQVDGEIRSQYDLLHPERIGCANYFRANRFKNYAICMKQCQGLGDVYLKMLEVEDDNKENYSGTQ